MLPLPQAGCPLPVGVDEDGKRYYHNLATSGAAGKLVQNVTMACGRAFAAKGIDLVVHPSLFEDVPSEAPPLFSDFAFDYNGDGRAVIDGQALHDKIMREGMEEAAKEAVKGVGFDLLIVCGFAFDPHVSEEAKRYGTLTVLPTRMNPDLAMGDELLKKTGAGNLFMVFGEPDLEIKRSDERSSDFSRYLPVTKQLKSLLRN